MARSTLSAHILLLSIAAVMLTGVTKESMCCAHPVIPDDEQRSNDTDEDTTRHLTIKRWLAFGNSLVKHGITSFWWGEWGMAASTRQNDFCHVLNDLVTRETVTPPDFSYYNLINWETNHRTYDYSAIDRLFHGDEDLVILRFGECIYDLYTFTQDMETFIDTIRSHAPHCAMVITGCFWPNASRDQVQLAACDGRKCIWCPLDYLYRNPENRATVNSRVYGDDSLWHRISDGGDISGSVAAHPGDLGHRRIAQAIFNAIASTFHFEPLAIEGITSGPVTVRQVQYFNASGMRIPGPEGRGFFIRRIIYSDGSQKTEKLMLR